MEKNKISQKTLTIAFITYNDLTAKYLPYFLDSLKKQTFEDFNILVADNSEKKENENKRYIENNYKDISFEWMGENIGFARAYNKLIDRGRKEGSKYFLIVNPDTILESSVIQKLLDAIKDNDKLGSVCPKILSWDFANNEKTNIIDTCGLVMPKALRFSDLGQGEKDEGQFANQNIIGPSGACGLFRISALEAVKDKYGYFDERMFMYKEDCDLAYRLFVNNFQSKCITKAIVYHDRTVARQKSFIKSRQDKSKKIKKRSFVNQQLIFKKHWDRQNFSEKLSIIWYQIKVFIYILLFERYLFSLSSWGERQREPGIHTKGDKQ